ncbi:hypothetical protein C1645_741786 [Glomus cerebriforme]|uniref:Membrane permease n=1 Tax=Glomus cerebriforme TaxID=658196 RepID=A0A397SQR0_9GLOM|nr:hypothetical protein C1645_741786 [Glomus cerebriforme]
MARFPLAIKVSNLLVYVFLLGANLYSGLGPDNDDSPYRENHPTYISPAPFVFGVWGIIHFLLGGFVIYQWFGPQELILDGINWHFVGITLLNTLWLVLWQTDYLILAWITILITASQVSFVYRILKQNREGGANLNELIWIHAPFSLYHAWIFVIVVISTFAAFAPDKKDDESPSVLIKILVVIGLLVLESTAIGYIEKFKGDIAGAVVIAWSLYGIAVEQSDPVIHWVALVLAILTSIHIFVPIVKKIRNRSSDETAPLLG